MNLFTGCNPGYYAVGDGCTGCPAGTYKSTAGNSEVLCTNCTADQFLTSNVSSTAASDCGTCHFLLQFQGNLSTHKHARVVLSQRCPNFSCCFYIARMLLHFVSCTSRFKSSKRAIIFVTTSCHCGTNLFKLSGNYYIGSLVLFPER